MKMYHDGEIFVFTFQGGQIGSGKWRCIVKVTSSFFLSKPVRFEVENEDVSWWLNFRFYLSSRSDRKWKMKMYRDGYLRKKYLKYSKHWLGMWNIYQPVCIKMNNFKESNLCLFSLMKLSILHCEREKKCSLNNSTKDLTKTLTIGIFHMWTLPLLLLILFQSFLIDFYQGAKNGQHT